MSEFCGIKLFLNMFFWRHILYFKKKEGVFSVQKKNANKGKLLLWLRDIYEDFL